MKTCLSVLGFNDLVDIIISKSDITCLKLYFDDFFTSYKLLSELSDKGVRATGTIRETRIANATKKIINSKDIKKEERGTFNFCSDGKVYVAKWHDNSIVTIASNWENHEPVYKVRRRFKGGENKFHSRILYGPTIKEWAVSTKWIDLLNFIVKVYWLKSDIGHFS